MPGSPYMDEPPQGLWTWPRLLRWLTPTFTALSVVALWQGLLIEWFGLSAALLLASAIMRK
ncbi:MAG TPA: hypothetical protein EYN46_04975 [Candidatus Poseidoniales archaeon]|nr:hypothetical protein [Candidatus Poseidoniales archaeon]